MSTLAMRVIQVDVLNPLIRRITLQPFEGGVLPAFEAGSHIRVRIGPGNEWRHYSLIDLSSVTGKETTPKVYTIAVRLEAQGRGGSRYMHELKEGDELTIEPPRNDFPLREHAGSVVLVAGGIGVTPLLTMAARCRAKGRPVRMVYAGRSRSLMAFQSELTELLGSALKIHADEDLGAPLSLEELLDGCASEDRLYVCGPQPMLDAVLGAAQARGWDIERVYFELFTTAAPQDGDHAFELVLAQSDQSFMVPADQSILDCLIEHGCDPLFDCKRGECGVCAVPVIEGDIDHRDYVLTPREKAAANVIQICISRAKGPRLVIDL